MAPKRKLCLPSSSSSSESDNGDLYLQVKRVKDEDHENPEGHLQDPQEIESDPEIAFSSEDDDEKDDVQPVDDQEEGEGEEDLNGHEEAKEELRKLVCGVPTIPQPTSAGTPNEQRNGREVLSKKCTSKKLWTDDDESTMLRGMLAFKLKRGSDALSRMSEFYEYIKGEFHTCFTKQQVVDKLRGLKRKYNKIEAKGVGLEELVFACPHQKNLFLLSRKVWGSVEDPKEEIESAPEIAFSEDDDNDDDDIQLFDDHEDQEEEEDVEMDKLPNEEVADSEETVRDVDDREEARDFWTAHPRLNESLKLEEFSGYTLPVSGVDAVKERLSSIGRFKAAEFEDRWRKLQVAETELKLMRALLIQDQTKLILDLM